MRFQLCLLIAMLAIFFASSSIVDAFSLEITPREYIIRQTLPLNAGMTFQVEPGELIPLTELRLFIQQEDNEKTFVCDFDVHGILLEQCHDLLIEANQANNYTQSHGLLQGTFNNTHYVFGKGDGYAEPLHYTAVINTAFIPEGAYTLRLRATVDEYDFYSQSKAFVVWPPPVFGDLNNDGFVNPTDLLLLQQAWGSTNSAADLNGDFIVNILDLLLLFEHWTA